MRRYDRYTDTWCAAPSPPGTGERSPRISASITCRALLLVLDSPHDRHQGRTHVAGLKLAGDNAHLGSVIMKMLRHRAEHVSSWAAPSGAPLPEGVIPPAGLR